MVCEAQDVVNVLVFDVLVDSRFPVLSSASTLSAVSYTHLTLPTISRV